MDSKYVQLFKEIVHATELLAERIMEINHEQKDEKSENTAKIMRDDYSKLYDKLRVSDFDSTTLTTAEYAKLLVGTLIVVNNMEERVANEKKALLGYKTDIIPKLQRIVDECKTNEEALNLAKEIFIISET